MRNPKPALSVKIGGSNFLNRGYRNTPGGLTVKGLYYVSLWWNWSEGLCRVANS